MTTFDLNARPEALVRDTATNINPHTGNTSREVVFQPLRSCRSLEPGDCLTVTLEAPGWARSVIVMQTTPQPSAGHYLALEVGGLDLESIGAPLPFYPGTSAAGRSLRGVIVSDSVRVSLTLGQIPKALDLRVIFLDH
jgi:hypothetical protein